MGQTFVVNFIGTATSNVIQQLAYKTKNHGGRWLVSKVNFIDNQVAGIIKIEVPDAQLESMQQAFLSHPDLTAFLNEGIHTEPVLQVYQLKISAPDTEELQQRIMNYLNQQAITIMDMDIFRNHEIISGEIVTAITSTMSIRIPDNVRIQDIRSELCALSIDLKVEILP